MRISDWSSDVCSSGLIGILGRDRVDRRLAVGAHLRILAAKGFELLLDLGAWQLGLLQILDRAALCIEPVAVARDELALREVAIDETAGVDRRRAIGITAALVAIAAEDEHSAADERDGPDPGEQHLLALRDLRIEIASPAFARFRRARQRLLFSVLLCCLGHQSSPPLAKTRKALVASPGASASRP